MTSKLPDFLVISSRDLELQFSGLSDDRSVFLWTFAAFSLIFSPVPVPFVEKFGFWFVKPLNTDL